MTSANALPALPEPTSSRPRSLLWVRAAWLATMAVMVPLCVVGYVEALRRPSLLDQEDIVRTVESFGVPVQAVMVWALVIPWAIVVVSSVLVFSRRPDSPVPLIQVGALVVLFAYFGRSLVALGAAHSSLAFVTTVASVLGGLAMIHFFLTFPTGTFEPRWSAGLLAAAGVLFLIEPDTMAALMQLTENEAPQGVMRLYVSAISALILASVGVQAYRYHRQHGWVERQQVRWAMFPLLIFALYIFLVIFIPILVFDVPDRWVALAVVSVTPLGFLIPVGIVLAILRYRLYDVDVVINRTLVYGGLTGILGLCYLGLVTVLQMVLQPLTPESDLAVALSTLVVAALVRPLRTRVQTFIDRRFYRSKYDANAMLEGFSVRLKDHIELDSLSRELVGVVGSAMQPAHARLWLRSRSQRG